MPYFTSTRLLRRLCSSDLNIRRSALIALDIETDSVELQDLIPFLLDEDPAIRRLAVGWLGATGQATALPALLDTLGDDDWEVFSAARKVIQEFRTRDTIDIFIAGTQHHNTSARIESVFALGEIRHARALPALQKAGEDLSAEVRTTALTALAAFGIDSVRHVLLQGLYDEDATVRRVAIEALATRDGEESTPYLLRMLNDRDSEVRRTAIKALEQCSTNAPVLIAALKDSNWQIVKAAVAVLGKQRRPIARLLRPLLKHPHLEVRLAATVAIEQIRTTRSAVRDAIQTDTRLFLFSGGAETTGPIEDEVRQRAA